jgi:hypothetical protein
MGASESRNRPYIATEEHADSRNAGVEIQVHALNGEQFMVRVIPGETTGLDIGKQLKQLDQDKEWILTSATGETIGVARDTSPITQEMIDASSGGKWSLVCVNITISLLAGEKGSLQNYAPMAPTALIIPGTCLRPTLMSVLQRMGAELGEYTDHDMKGSRGVGRWEDAHKVRLYTDITFPENNIVCVAVANFPHPRAYSECPDVVQPFTEQTVEEYLDKYRLAMDAVSHHCHHLVENFATVPMGTVQSHIKEGATPVLLSRLVPALREHLRQTGPVKHLDLLCFDDQWNGLLSQGADNVEKE